MIYLEGAMRRKVNWWIAALIILIVTISAAWAISAKAYVAWYFGGRITLVIAPSICSDPETCGACKNCGCGTWYDVTIQKFRGGQFYICIPAGFPVQGKGLVPGLRILGGGTSDRTPQWIWTTP